MKIVNYKRIEKPGTASLCTMDFNKDSTVTLDFGKKDGGKLKLPTDFLADAVEYYLTHIITLGVQKCRSKKALRKK